MVIYSPLNGLEPSASSWAKLQLSLLYDELHKAICLMLSALLNTFAASKIRHNYGNTLGLVIRKLKALVCIRECLIKSKNSISKPLKDYKIE